MEYEIVNLEEKTVVGVSVETSNEDPQMQMKIGGLWGKLYQEGVIATIKNRVNEYAIGLYSDYSEKGYVASACVEVSENQNKELYATTIPAGKYAKFTIHGDMVTAVGNAWAEIWQMDLERSYTGDFEEYVDNDPVNATIYIYIALK